jgi:hypothetical protein
MTRVFDYQQGRNVDRPDAPNKPSKRSKLEDDFAAELKLYGIPDPVRQYRFHPVRLWRFDFAWPEQKKIAVEIHGGIFMKAGTGGHNRGGYMEQSFEKSNEAQRLGWKVFIFGPKACRAKKRTTESSAALKFIYEIFNACAAE